MIKMRKILKFLYVIQEVSNKNRNPKLGLGFSTARRLNPFNPLSYLAVIIVVIVGHLMFGFIGFWKETDGFNPFKWR